jgi:ubiquinone/menaquinone biosynthesis C-methylase UbiE
MASMLTPPRVISDELLDEHDAPRADVERSLRDLRRFNAWAGGRRIYRSLVRRFQPHSVLDIGAGSCELVESLSANCFRIGLDFKIDHLVYLREGSPVHRVVGDALHLPFREGAVDAVTSNHFFHHFSAEENESILAEALRVARKGVAMNDTRRHYVPLAFTLLLAKLHLVGRITRNDAPASVRQGYTLGEARAIAERVPAPRRAVVRKFPYRFGILLWKT